MRHSQVALERRSCAGLTCSTLELVRRALHPTTRAGAAHLTAGNGEKCSSTGTGAACTAGAGEAWLTARAGLMYSTIGAGARFSAGAREQDTPSQELVRQALRERRT